MECACCFDTAPISRITHCNGDEIHLFCYDCARSNADHNIGLNRYDLQCMDGSGCKATFSRAERAKFLDPKSLEKLENLEQEAAIRSVKDDLKDFVACPFCQYGHICPPVEVDREFRCGFLDCREVKQTVPLLNASQLNFADIMPLVQRKVAYSSIMRRVQEGEWCQPAPRHRGSSD